MTAIGSRTEIPRQQGGGQARPATAPKVPARVFRPRRMIPATIVAALIVIAAALTAVGVIATLVGRPIALLHAATIGSWLSRTQWSALPVPAIGAGLAVLGLVLIAIALIPGRLRVIPLGAGRPDVLMGITLGGLRRVAATAAADVDGVEHVHAKACGRRVRVTVGTPLRDRAEGAALEERVRTAVKEALDQLDLTRPVAVRVRVRKGR